MFIILKLLNIYLRKFISELFSPCIAHLPNCYTVRSHPSGQYYYHVRCPLNPDLSFREHLPSALPSQLIFYLLRSFPSNRLLRDYSAKLMLDTLETIIKWLQVSDSECN
jgi:hypothetical protein